MVLQQLYDDLDVSVVVLDADDAHDVRRVLCIRVVTVLVGQHETRVSFLDLQNKTNVILATSC